MVRGLVTDTWVVSEGGCASVASGDLRSGAPHTILSFPFYPILSHPILSLSIYPILSYYYCGNQPLGLQLFYSELTRHRKLVLFVLRNEWIWYGSVSFTIGIQKRFELGWLMFMVPLAFYTACRECFGLCDPGARFTNDFLPTIQIRWKHRLAVILLLAIRSKQIFVHATTAQVSCHVENFVAITVLESRWEFGCLHLGQWPMTYLMTLSDWTMSCQPWPPCARYGQWARYK